MTIEDYARRSFDFEAARSSLGPPFVPHPKKGGRLPSPRRNAGFVVAIAAAGIVGAFAACSDFSLPDATSTSSTLIVSPRTAHVNVGGSVQLAASGSSGGITWSSSDPTVATVTFGKVTGVASGTATIRAISG